jgi:energy-converting hydrogenase Eha subunit E
VRNMRPWAATAAVVLGVLGTSMAPAHADPINALNIQPFACLIEEVM